MTSAESNPEIVPGEMRLWTDRASAVRPAAGGPVLAPLVADLLKQVDGSVLVVGPHGDEVLAPVAARGGTVLVRALPDGEEIAGRHPGLRVVCGDLVHAALEPFDLVVALDGVDRVASNDFDPTPWRERFDRLVSLVAPGGVLAATVDNPESVLALADGRRLTERREFGDWEPPHDTDPTRPRRAGDVVAILEAAGLSATAFASGWVPSSPGVIAGPGARDDHRLRWALTRDVARLTGPLLLDPRGPVLARLADGRFAEVSSGWLLVAAGAGRSLALPGAVAAVGETRLELSAAEATAAPAGPTVADAAVTLAQAEDLVGLRALVRGYLTWAASETGPRLPDAVQVTGDEITRVVPADDVLAEGGDPAAVAAVWLARRLLAPDVRRIWPAWLGEDGVARTLLAMAGLDRDDAALGSAAADPVATLLVLDDVATLLEVNAQLRTELTAARGAVFAHERLAGNRDRQLEQRSVKLAQAAHRTEVAELRAQQAEDELNRHRRRFFRRALRAARRPRSSAKRILAKLRG
ncbi:MAG: hypothetical protein J7518_13390 [Nocardioidaceae bacterium]|nr:hypothetical protein [Nocardioidaceae bacterium]